MRDRRFEPRHAVAETTELHWTEPTASLQCAGRVCELSISGARIRVQRPIRVQTRMKLVLRGKELQGKVRFCTRDQADYMLGIEFDPEYHGVVKANSLSSVTPR